MFATDLMEQKPITRRTVLSRRDKLPSDVRAAASVAIGDAVATVIERVAAGSIVALYAPKGTEVETAHLDRLVRARGLRVVYPRIVDGDRRLAFHEVGVGELVPSQFGLREPRADAPAVGIAAIDVFVIPGLAFDRAGWRVGWGRGYYDATLAGAPAARRIGIAFECQIVDDVPHDVHDARMHAVVTETNVFRGEVA